MSPDAAAIADIRRFRSETDAIREAPEPRWAKVTVATLAAMFVVAIAIMVLTRIDRVVASGGKIVSTERVNVFQALEPSIIKTIDVSEGDVVEKGALLATLDPTFAAADARQLRQQIASLRTEIARYEALLSGAPLAFPETGDPDLARYAALQRSYYDQQRAQYEAELKSFEAKIAQVNATIAKYQSDESLYADREKVAAEIEKIRTTLAESGSGSKLNRLESQDQRFELIRSLEYSRNSLVEARQTLAALEADRDAFVRKWSADLSQAMLLARNNLDAAEAQLEKAAKRQDLVRLTALEPSVVLTVAKLSVGSVLKQGDPLFTLMPVDAPVEAEIEIPSRDIGFVRAGDPCVLKVGAFNHMEHGVAEGSIRWISDNAFTVGDDGQPAPAFYRARCSVERLNFRNLPDGFRLIPGMTLTADLKVGTRSVAMYLLSDLLGGFGDSMREP